MLRRGQRARAEDAEPDERRLRAQLDHDERDEQCDRSEEEPDRLAGSPAVRPGLDDRVDEHEQAARDGDGAGDVARLGLLLADLVRDDAQREQTRQRCRSAG